MNGLSLLAQGIVPAWLNQASELLAARPELREAAIDLLGKGTIDPLKRHELRWEILELVACGIEAQFCEGDPVTRAELRKSTEAVVASAQAHLKNLKRLGRQITEVHLLETLPALPHGIRETLEQISRADAVVLTYKPTPITSLEEQISALQVMIKVALEGRANREVVARELVGNWKAHFVAGAAKAFIRWRSKALTTTEGGAFHQFVNVAYELLTGDGPDEEGVGLKRYVEFVVPRVQELTEYLKREQKLVSAADRDDESDDLLKKIQQEIAALERELMLGPRKRKKARSRGTVRGHGR